MITSTIHFGSKQIDFQVEYSDRKTLGITVTPEMEVLVKAPIESTIRGKFIEVRAQNKSRVKPLVEKWYLEHARLKFKATAQPLIENFKKHKVEPNSLVLRDMPTRWGSCTPKGKIILNPELIKAPKGCIQYVIIHELCHLVHHDHTKKFFDLQTKEMPDWRRWKDKLENLLA